MKTILKFSLAVLVAMTTMSTYAINGDILLNVKQVNGKEISFAINQLQRANVTITDKFHNIIYSEIVTGKAGIFKTYSLEEFPEGTYFLEVETNLFYGRHCVYLAFQKGIHPPTRLAIA